jgi:DNA-binding GntR family transcriptional regulator
MTVAETDALAARSLSEAVRDRLMRLIANGALKPGERLNEVHLAEAFGISRGPVREAARELAGQGLLVSRPRLGFFVARFTRAEIVDVYEAKTWLEAALIDDLAVHCDRATRRAILAEIDGIDASDRVAFTESLFRFRLRMTARIRNRFLADLVLALYRKFYVIEAVIANAESTDRQARIVETLRRFWTSMAADEIAAARAVTAADTAHWLADLPPRFPGAPTPIAARERPKPDGAPPV